MAFQIECTPRVPEANARETVEASIVTAASPNRPSRLRLLARPILHATCVGLLAVSCGGCTLLSGARIALKRSDTCDEFLIGYRNRAMAEDAWHHAKRQFRNHHRCKDLKTGFIAGYMEVADGGDGCTPTICPPDYWGWQYQSPHGKQCVNAWFEGFPYGVKAAEQDGVGHWSYIEPYGSLASPAAAQNQAMQKPGEVDVEGRESVIELDAPLDGEPELPGDEYYDAPLQELLPPEPAVPENFGEFSFAPAGSGAIQTPAAPNSVNHRNSAAPLSTELVAPRQAEVDAIIDDIFGTVDSEVARQPQHLNEQLPFRFE